jgi:acetyl esterase/lipase
VTDILELPPPAAAVRIPYGADPNQFGELRLPAGAGFHPVVIAIHGGFWRARYDLTHLGHLCQAITSAGFATWSLEYRRVGLAGGGFPGTMEDVGCGADFLLQLAGRFPLDVERVVAIGHSAGGQLALWLGARRRSVFRLRGVVALAAVSDLTRASALRLGDGIVDDMMGGTPATVPKGYAAASPIELLPAGVPQRLIHGEDDDVVPLSLSERYCEAARGCGDDVALEPLPKTGHLELIDPRSHAWPVVLRALCNLLGRAEHPQTRE